MSKLNPRVDFIFKRLFGVEENKDLLIDLINSFNIVPEENYHNVYRLINLKTGKEYMDHLELHFIELDKYDGHKKAKTLLDKWTYFLKEAGEFEKAPVELEEVDTIKKALEVLNSIRMTDEERDVYEAKLKWLRDEESALRTAKNEGIAEGITEGILAVAKNMISEGMDIEIIAKITKLSKEEILNLKNN